MSLVSPRDDVNVNYILILKVQNCSTYVILVFLSPNFQSVLGYWQPFWTTPNDLKTTLNTTRPKVPHICITGVTEPIISHFRVTGHFWESCTKRPRMTLNTTRSNLPHICYQCPRVPNFTPFRSTTSHFWLTGHYETTHSTISRFGLTGHFETSAPNDAKWPWMVR